MSCQELVELVTDYLDEVLPVSERDRFEVHMSNCVGCTDYLAQMRLTLRLSGRIEEVSLEPRVRDELLDAFRDWKSGGA